MSLTFGLSPLLLVLLLLAAGAASFWMYRRTVPRVDGGGRVLLSSLRFLSLGILVVLLFEPLLDRQESQSDPPVVAILVDDSESAALSPEDSAAVLNTVRDMQTALGEPAPVFRFGGTLTVDAPDSARFTQGRTDIAGALERALKEVEGQNLSGVVLVSDGRYNTGRNPLHVADRFPVPIYTVTVGDTTARQDILVRRMLTNEVAYRGVVLPIEVGISHQGFGGQNVTVSLLQNGRVLDQAPVSLIQDAGEQTVSLSVTPDTTGLIRYDVTVTRAEGEFTYRNNTASTSVRVLESRRRVLLLAGAPSPDLTALRASIGSDEDLEVVQFVRNPQGGYFQGTPPSPADFDVLLLSGWPSAGTPLGEVDTVSEAISNGLPTLFKLDNSTDLALMQRMGQALPVIPRVRRQGRTEGAPVITAQGRRHPILELPDGIPDNAWSSLPPLLVTDVTWQTAPDSETLVTTSIRGVVLDDPLLVVRRRGGSRSLAFLASGAWRWANLPPSLERLDPVWPRLVENAIQWLGAPEDDRPVRVNPTATTFQGGERVTFSGQVYDESAQPVSGATLDLEITAPDGTTLPFAMRAIGSGRYRADAGVLPEGSYAYRAEATFGDTMLGTDTGSFAVGPLALEFRNGGADAPLMRQLALRSGGKSAGPAEVDDLVAAITSAEGYAPRERVVTSSLRLWQSLPFLFVVLALLTAEWFLRKRRGLV